jgi:CelD/BcsL family acetyltransferase involved in cellulose biosynthesis
MVEYIDFGLGDLEYKKSICDQQWQDAVLNIYGPNIKGATIKILNSLGVLYKRYRRNKQK